MTISAVNLLHLGLAPQLASELKRQVDVDVAVEAAARVAQRDIDVIQSAVAATGTSISGAYASTGDIVHVGSTSASSNDGLKLRIPTTTNSRQVIINRGVSPLKVYPPNDISYINALARAAAYTLSATQSAEFWGVNTGTTVGSVVQYHYIGEF